VLQTGPGPVSNVVTQVPTLEQPPSIAYSQVTLDGSDVATVGQSLVVLQVLACGPPSPAPLLAPDVAPLAEPDSPVAEDPDPDFVDPVAAVPADAVCPEEPTAVPEVAVPLVPPSEGSPTRKPLPPQPTVDIKAAQSAGRRRARTTRTGRMVKH
jgi:hypothetical protein